jgi:YD repeat-containing protein
LTFCSPTNKAVAAEISLGSPTRSATASPPLSIPRVECSASATISVKQLAINGDALNRSLNATDPEGGVTSFTYDANNNLLSVTAPRGNVISYAYDSQDRAVSRTGPLLHGDSYQYDLDGLSAPGDESQRSGYELPRELSASMRDSSWRCQSF